MDINEQIINMLRSDSRISFSEIGRKLKLSEGAIRKRVNNLVNKGIIKNFTIETADTYSAIVCIKTDPQILTKEIIENLKQLNVNKAFETTGRFDLICVINSNNAEEINNSLEKIRTSKGITGTETFSVLKES